ncbi:VOC family protein [Devosia sp. 2618]|uniref:VOC family protein n=1 Tax=Devosia sp. 2618 TaxID=3156454 RepID=UPI00339629CF
MEVFSKDSARYDETNQINHFCFETDDLDGLILHLRAQGISVTDKKRGADNTWQSWTADPDGVKLEIFQYTDESMQFGPRGAVCEVDW